MIIDNFDIEKVVEDNKIVYKTGFSISITQQADREAEKLFDNFEEVIKSRMLRMVKREFEKMAHENLLYECDKQRNIPSWYGIPIYVSPNLKENEFMILMHPKDLADKLMASPLTITWKST